MTHLPYGSGRQTSGRGKVFSMRTPAVKGGGGVKKLENLTDVLYGLPLTQKYQLPTNETSTITIFTCIINYIY